MTNPAKDKLAPVKIKKTKKSGSIIETIKSRQTEELILALCGSLGSGTSTIADKIKAVFGSYESFTEQFKNAGMTQFGSGWAWLVAKDDDLEIMKTPNADTPLAHGLKPLLTVDVWEHAYYLDYQNRRADYLSAFLQDLVNWGFVNSQLG